MNQRELITPKKRSGRGGETRSSTPRLGFTASPTTKNFLLAFHSGQINFEGAMPFLSTKSSLQIVLR